MSLEKYFLAGLKPANWVWDHVGMSLTLYVLILGIVIGMIAFFCYIDFLEAKKKGDDPWAGYAEAFVPVLVGTALSPFIILYGPLIFVFVSIVIAPALAVIAIPVGIGLYAAHWYKSGKSFEELIKELLK